MKRKRKRNRKRKDKDREKEHYDCDAWLLCCSMGQASIPVP